jgi:hypothetical protein
VRRREESAKVRTLSLPGGLHPVAFSASLHQSAQSENIFAQEHGLRAKTLGVGALVLAGALAAAGALSAAERATAKEAETMVHKAVAHIKASRAQAFAQISDTKGPYVDRDLYLVVYRIDGTNLAHGFNPKFIGKNMMEMRDIDGKAYMQERMEWARTKDAFWQDLKFVDPLTRKIEPKQIYCEKLEDMLVCGGIYKI